MKITIRGTIAAIILAIASTTASAKEGLQIVVQGSDVVLSWSSNPGETYIIQYRPTLSPDTPWLTLTSTYPANWSASTTIFVDSNRVQTASGNLANLAMSSTTTSQSFSPALVQAVLNGQSSYPLSSAPRPLVRNSAGQMVPWEQVYGPVKPIIMPISDALRQRVLASLNQDSLSPVASPAIPLPMDGPQPDPGFYQVVKDGVAIVGATNLTSSVISDTVNVQFEAANADPNGTNIVGTVLDAMLVLDGGKFAGESIVSAPLTFPWQIAMDTGYLENGTHMLQVQVCWLNTNAMDGHPYITRTSDPVFITVSNAIYYPDWEQEIGETDVSAYFAKTTCLDTDWNIDIFDVRSNFVQRLSGHTTDGTIEAYWNMTDASGVIRTNIDYDPEFSSVITVSDPATKASPKKKPRKKDFPGQGAWAVSYQDMYGYDYSSGDEQLGSIDEFAYLAYRHGGVFLLAGATTNFDFQSYPVRYKDPRHPNPNVTQQEVWNDYALLQVILTNTMVRNFYWSGHGNDTFIGDMRGIHLFNAGLRHRYRFVFLDGCQTAKGNLDHLFGIKGPETFALTYYHNTGIRPAVFCGYSQDVEYTVGGPQYHNGFLYDDEIPWEVPAFITNFLFFWEQMHYPVDIAFSASKSYLPVVPGLGTQPGDNLRLYGYLNLGVDDFNYQSNNW